MPKSVRHQNAARKAVQQPAPRNVYRITDPHHMPDMRGEFAGAKVKAQGAAQTVRLTAAQAKYYLDCGALELLNS